MTELENDIITELEKLDKQNNSRKTQKETIERERGRCRRRKRGRYRERKRV